MWTRKWLFLILGMALLLTVGAPDLVAKKPAPPPQTDPDPAIAYIEDGSLMVMSADGTNRTVVLANAGSSAQGPDWSPDGTQLAFFSDIQGHGVYVINVDGTGLRKVTGLYDTLSTRVAWSPKPVEGVGDGNVCIAYSDRMPGSDRPDLFLVSVDGGHRARLTDTPDADERFPTWSPSATRLACKVYEASGGHLWGLYDFATDTYDIRSHGGAIEGTLVTDPAWSKTHENKIAWTSDALDGLLDIWVVDLGDAAHPVRLTSTTSKAECLASWSPDGTELVIRSATKKGSSLRDHVFEIMSSADGADRRVIASGQGAPVWRRNVD